ncbi:MAG: YdiU family protein [Myxococcota bacterium]
MPASENYQPAPRFADLGEGFADPVQAALFPQHRLRFRNDRWAKKVGLDALTESEWQNHFARFQPLPDNLSTPLAMRYHGHQFLTYNPDLGDGRGFLFAQLQDDEHRLLDLGTKGSGQTPYSRGGDGRLTLKGGVRETLCTEMLEALGVNTSKTFSLFETGESLHRHDEPSPTRASVLVRLSHSHLRFGTFQRLAYLRKFDHLKRLVEYTVEHYLPEAAAAPEGPVYGIIDTVVTRAAELAASYMAAGFVHGVLNTDNMNITGESFDYGPYRFLPTYDSAFVAAYFDQTGLYAFGRQPHAILWNLTQLVEALQNIESGQPLAPPLDAFRHRFSSAFLRQILDRLGVAPQSEDQDMALAEALFTFLENSNVGYDRFFFDWYGGPLRGEQAITGPSATFYADASFKQVRTALEGYSPKQPLDPYFESDQPCSLLVDEIEQIWAAIDQHDDWSPFEAKVAQIRTLGDALRPVDMPKTD